MKNLRHRIDRILHSVFMEKGYKCTNRVLHVMYFGTVAIESHGSYAMIAGGLGLMLIINIFIGLGND